MNKSSQTKQRNKKQKQKNKRERPTTTPITVKRTFWLQQEPYKQILNLLLFLFVISTHGKMYC